MHRRHYRSACFLSSISGHICAYLPTIYALDVALARVDTSASGLTVASRALTPISLDCYGTAYHFCCSKVAVSPGAADNDRNTVQSRRCCYGRGRKSRVRGQVPAGVYAPSDICATLLTPFIVLRVTPKADAERAETGTIGRRYACQSWGRGWRRLGSKGSWPANWLDNRVYH